MNIVVVLAAALCAAVELSDSSRVKLINNGYEGLVIAINPAVPEDPQLIDAIKDMVGDASAYLFKATNRLAYFKHVSILIPFFWSSQSNYTRPKYESYGKAEVRIASLDDPEDDSPYTQQYGQCGEPGQYIQLTPNFLLADKNLDAYCPRGAFILWDEAHAAFVHVRPWVKRAICRFVRYEHVVQGSILRGHPSTILEDWRGLNHAPEKYKVQGLLDHMQICETAKPIGLKFVYRCTGRAFVHEWGHLRWGLFDEYNEDEPFYLHGNNVEFTRCSRGVTGGTGVVSCSSIGSCKVQACKIGINGLPEQGCMFFPDKVQMARESIMALQWLDNVEEFCTVNSHNRNAPNLQNRLCSSSSAWDIMQKHEDFNNNEPPPADVPTQPTFSLLRPSHRVITLVLDKSGSMSGGSRLQRLRQAADIFIMQILEEGEMVGIVTFDSSAQTKCGLTLITDTGSRVALKSCLPTGAGGGTNICAGVSKGFQVLSGDDGSASGDEIVLMTDGEDGGISSCFEAVRTSGCTIHTIALGPSAVKELEKLAELSGGLNFFASDNVDGNALGDAFTSITTDNGDSDALVIQLESTGKVLNSNQWMDGDVNIDASIGNNTQFVVIWQSSVPEMHITDPNNVTYQNGDFVIDGTFKTARLTIPGRAMVCFVSRFFRTGTWKYWLINKAGSTDTLTLTVTSMASSKGVPPITVEANMQAFGSISLSALTIYAEVKRGTTPVVGANVTTLIERPGSATLEIELLDNGASADIKKNDGVYSRYFTQYTSSGRYSLKVRVAGSKEATRLAPRRGSKAIFIPGFRNERGELEITQVPAPAVGQVLVPSEDFSRVASGGSFQATVPPGGPLDIYPPCRVLDLTVELLALGIVSLAWTAPEDDADFGQASKYEIITSDSIEGLLNGTEEMIVPEDNVTMGNTSDPAVAGSTETFAISIAELQPGNSLYFSVRAIDKKKTKGENSNVASVAPAVIVVPTKAPNGGGPPTIFEPACTVYFMITIITLLVTVFPTS
ncbi:LOW QUALITY PROTEIN: calcium-activated chloride channel regulator 1-like [Petromyzon marinus]|uniref:LOW QUALITY PROTEIN: calcium-activated chloride channel regulator 1-like n=1 Tax=Petromyzon marinus TaxID=7757 RepID=UPI003F6F5ACD